MIEVGGVFKLCVLNQVMKKMMVWNTTKKEKKKQDMNTYTDIKKK